AVGEVNLAERLGRLGLGTGPDFEASYLLGKALAGEGRVAEAVETWKVAGGLARRALGTGAGFESSSLLGKALAGEGRFEEAVETWKSAEEVAASDAQRATLAAGSAPPPLRGLRPPGETR